MRFFLRYSLCLLCLVTTTAFAQERSIFQTFADDISESVLLGIKYYNFPSRFDNDDWINLAGSATLTLSAMAFDKSARSAFGTIATNGILDGSMSVFREYGEVKYAVGGSAAVYITGLVSGSDEIRRVGKNLLQTLVYSSIVTTSMKVIVGRSRPFKNEGAYHYQPFTVHDENMSLPSGHTTVAFALSSVLAAEIDNTFASVGLFTLASLTGISRMYEDRHWLSDVLLGAAIGTSTGYFVVHKNRVHSSNEETTSAILIQPTLSGISFQYTF